MTPGASANRRRQAPRRRARNGGETRRKAASCREPDHLAVKGSPSATVQVGWLICRFANGSCMCKSRNHYPCVSVQVTARAVIDAVKEELAETYVLRKRPHKSAVDAAGKPAVDAAPDRDRNKFRPPANPHIDGGRERP